jgi:hypothetical protein
MGRFEIQSETVFDYEREVVWDFATNPNNWVSQCSFRQCALSMNFSPLQKTKSLTHTYP